MIYPETHLALLQCTTAAQTSLKRKYEEVSEEKAEAIRTRVKIDLDVKEQEEQAKGDAKTQVSMFTIRMAL